MFRFDICFDAFYRFIGEESTKEGEHWDLTDNPTWIIDPIDGTTNFVHRFDHLSFRIYPNMLDIVFNGMWLVGSCIVDFMTVRGMPGEEEDEKRG